MGKRKRKFYAQLKKKPNRAKMMLRPGLRGFMCSCNNHEKECVEEAYNLFNEYADIMYGPEQQDGDVSDHSDVEAAMSSEAIQMQQREKPRRFQQMMTFANNCIFIATQVEDPATLVEQIYEDIEKTRQQKTRFMLRMIPVEATCHANKEDILKTFAPLVDKYFTKEGKLFGILYKTRNSGSVKRDDLLAALAEKIKDRNPLNKVELKNPELWVNVSVIRNVCCLSVLNHYNRFKKYNMAEMAGAAGQGEGSNGGVMEKMGVGDST